MILGASDVDRRARALGLFKRQRPIDLVGGGVVLVVVVPVVVGFLIYIVNTDGAAQLSAGFAGFLVLVGVWLLFWSYRRRPPVGQEDFVDKFLVGTGQTLLLGAVLSFGFGIVGNQLDNEQKERDEQQAAEQKERDEQQAEEQAAADLRRDLAGQVRADAGGRSFPSVDLEEQSFVDLDLSRFHFAKANLSQANLFSADLTRANLVEADLTDAVLIEADLTDAWLAFADLTEADLTRAILVGTILVGADLTNANLTNANLAKADLTDADLTDAILTDALYDATTVWPDGFSPPRTAVLVEN